jgi:hypothetical protein
MLKLQTTKCRCRQKICKFEEVTDRTAERKILSEIATAVGAAAETLQPAPVTGFLSMKGDSYQGELMWVGRAVNGWTKGWNPMELRQPDNVAAFVETVCKSVSGGSGNGQTCPMRWVSAFWGSKDGYNTNRSAFWRTVRRTVHELKIADVEQDNWPSHMVWSNLYKVAPEAGWNPNGKLAKVQREKCRELLLHEVSTLRPKRLVFATGSDWAAGLLSRFRRGGQRMLSVIPSFGLVWDADHGRQIPCCRKRRAAA